MMEQYATIDSECNALGLLFQQTVDSMKGSYPVWEDFMSKASKLHIALRSTIVAFGAFLETFQKIADMATNTKGATRDIGAALTRLCLRHKSIDSKVKLLNVALMDSLVNPLQEKMDDWKKNGSQLDKEHLKEYKKAKSDIKKSAAESLKVQKKVKKGKSKEMQKQLDAAMSDVNKKYSILEESEKAALRAALMEERSRFCHFIKCLTPVMDQEIGLISEVTHLQEILQQLGNQSADPQSLPPASEQVINDIKGSSAAVSFQTPPSSPSSIGSRKSSMCSINSITSSSSGGSKTHSPSHHYHRSHSASQQPNVNRLTSVSSQDSGFTSQDAIFLRPPSPSMLGLHRPNSQSSIGDTHSNASSEASTASSPYPGPPSASSTWNNWPEQPQNGRSDQVLERPHTISSAYEKSHVRPALNSQTFEPPENDRNAKTPTNELDDREMMPPPSSASSSSNIYARPVISAPRRSSIRDSMVKQDGPPVGPKPKPKAVAMPTVPKGSEYANLSGENSPQPPVYVNMDDLKTMAVENQRAEFEKMTIPGHIPRKMSLPTQLTQSKELADAIRNLEAQTTALDMTYETSRALQIQALNVQDSPGTSDEIDKCMEELEHVELRDKCRTLPRKFTSGQKTGRALFAQRARPASYSGGNFAGLAAARRASLPNKPPPPIRRSSSVQGAKRVDIPTIPGMQVHPPGATSVEGTPTHRRHHSVTNEVQYGNIGMGVSHGNRMGVAVLPGNASPLIHHHHPVQQHEDFPIYADVEYGNDLTPTAETFGSQQTGMIHSLNAKYNETQPQHGTEDLPPPPPPDSPPPAYASANTFLGQIQRGVKLRKVTSNDRSVPWIHKK